MIDVEVDIFDYVANAIYKEFPHAYVSSKNVVAPPQFPAVSIVEKTNLPLSSAMDSSGRERASSLSYVVNVYSNSEMRSKEECKELMGIVSNVMLTKNITRTMCSAIDNLADPSIYRMIGRFGAVVDENHVMYRR